MNTPQNTTPALENAQATPQAPRASGATDTLISSVAPAQTAPATAPRTKPRAPKSAPAHKAQDGTPAQNAPAPSPAPVTITKIDANLKVSGLTTPRWLAFFAMFVRLIWPLAVLGSGIALFVIIGGSGWLFLVLLLVIVCALCARPQQPPNAAP